MLYFCIGFAIDCIAAYYSCSVAKGRAHSASFASALLFVSGVLLGRDLLIVEKLPLLEIAAVAAGYYAGTFVVVRYFRWEERRNVSI